MSTIVVGVDGSPGSKDALRWALTEARLRGAALRVVHVWRLPLVVGLPEAGVLGHPVIGQPPVEEVVGDYEQRAGQVLDAALEGIDGVELERVLAEGNPAHELIEAATNADLLVLGSRGHGGFTGLLLGSVSQQCAHHAQCPIVIVPRAEETS